MFVDPNDTGVTTPELLTVATAGFDEAQVYIKVGVPVACEVSDKEPPIQTALPPVIAPAIGNAFTVTEWVADCAEHEVELPSITVYLMFVDPADTPVTLPVLFTVATPVFEEVQAYVKVGVPVAFGVKDKMLAVQTELPPDIGFATGKELTVTG